MSSIEKFLARLKTVQSELAVASLSSPEDKNAFGFGQASGIQKGLKIAEKILEDMLTEDSGENKQRTKS